MLSGKGAQVCYVLCGIGFGFGCQISQKLNHLFGRIGHFEHHRDLAEVGIPQQLRLFLAQSQDILNQGAVIKTGTSALRLVGGAGDVCGVQSAPQVAVFCKLHHRQVAGHFEGELVAVLAVCLGGGSSCGLHILWHARQLFSLSKVGKSVGGIQRVFAELLLQLGLTFLYFSKTRFLGALQVCATQYKTAQRIAQRLLLFGVKGFRA